MTTQLTVVLFLPALSLAFLSSIANVYIFVNYNGGIIFIPH